VKELHFTTYTDYETIAAWSNTYIHTKQTPRSLFSSSSLLLLFSLVTVEWKYVKSGKTRIHTHLKIYYQHHFDFFYILFFFFSSPSFIVIEIISCILRKMLLVVLMLLLCAYVYPLSTTSATNTSLAHFPSTTNDCFLLFSFSLLRKKYVDLLQIVYMISLLKESNVQKLIL